MRGRSRPRGEPGAPPSTHAYTHPSLPPRRGREEAGRCHHPAAAQRKEGAGPLGSAGRSATARPTRRPRGATRGSPGPAPSPHPSFARAFASPLFLCVCVCLCDDFLTLLPHPANSGYLWLRRHSPFSPPPRVYPTGGVASVVPLCKLFPVPSPRPSGALAAAGPLASVQLSCRPIELGESPGWRGRAGRGRGAAGAGTPAGPTFSERFSLARGPLERSLRPSGRREAECERKVRLQSPQMSQSRRVGIRFFARNFKATIADTLAIPFPGHFNAGPLFGTFFPPGFVSVCKYIDEQ